MTTTKTTTTAAAELHGLQWAGTMPCVIQCVHTHTDSRCWCARARTSTISTHTSSQVAVPFSAVQWSPWHITTTTAPLSRPSTTFHSTAVDECPSLPPPPPHRHTPLIRSSGNQSIKTIISVWSNTLTNQHVPEEENRLHRAHFARNERMLEWSYAHKLCLVFNDNRLTLAWSASHSLVQWSARFERARCCGTAVIYEMVTQMSCPQWYCSHRHRRRHPLRHRTPNTWKWHSTTHHTDHRPMASHTNLPLHPLPLSTFRRLPMARTFETINLVVLGFLENPRSWPEGGTDCWFKLRSKLPTDTRMNTNLQCEW